MLMAVFERGSSGVRNKGLQTVQFLILFDSKFNLFLGIWSGLIATLSTCHEILQSDLLNPAKEASKWVMFKDVIEANNYIFVVVVMMVA